MSPALKLKKSEDAPRVERRLGAAAAGAAPQRNTPREQQEAIERAYRQDDPHVPSLPGSVKVAIFVAGVTASWFAVISLVKAVTS